MVDSLSLVPVGGGLPRAYVRPAIVGKRPAAPRVNEIQIILIALALAIIYYGSLTGFCLAVCGGWGHIKSCEAQWGVWAKATCYR